MGHDTVSLEFNVIVASMSCYDVFVTVTDLSVIPRQKNC